METGDVVRLGEGPHENHVVSALATSNGLIGGEHDLPLGRARRGRDARGERLVVEGGVERRVKQSLELAGVHPADCLLLGPPVCLDHVDCHLHSRLSRTLGTARLKDVEAPLLDRELDVLHVVVMPIELLEDLEQAGVNLGHETGQLRERTGIANPRHDVFALCVQEKVARRLGPARVLVTAESDPGRGRLALVAEDHLLHVHGRAPVVGNPVQPAVCNRPLSVPRVEHRLDRQA